LSQLNFKFLVFFVGLNRPLMIDRRCLDSNLDIPYQPGGHLYN
jgi:hypothetical protein